MSDEINIVVEPEIPEEFQQSLSKIKDRSENMSRSGDRGIINEKSGASVIARDNGQINLSSNEYSQYKLSPSGRAIEISLESTTTTNRKNYEIDDYIINSHKLNPHLYGLTDYKKVMQSSNLIVGNFCVDGTVLAKCWEPNLGRYVLIRRPSRMPMFSNLLNVPSIPSALKVTDPIDSAANIQASMSAGADSKFVNVTNGNATTAEKTNSIASAPTTSTSSSDLSIVNTEIAAKLNSAQTAAREALNLYNSVKKEYDSVVTALEKAVDSYAKSTTEDAKAKLKTEIVTLKDSVLILEEKKKTSLVDYNEKRILLNNLISSGM